MGDSNRPPEADLMDTVAHMQLEVEALKCVQSGPSTSVARALPVQSKPAVFTSAKVPYNSLRSPYNSCPTWRGTH